VALVVRILEEVDDCAHVVSAHPLDRSLLETEIARSCEFFPERHADRGDDRQQAERSPVGDSPTLVARR